MRTPLFLHFCVLLTSTLFSNSCIMASEVIHLPAPIIKKVIHHSLASNPDEFSKTIEQARRIVSGIPNKQWHELVIQILYEEYKEDGATKLILACELSTEPLISIWIRRYICLQTNDSSRELDKAIMNTTPLISAVAMKSLGVTRLLLAHGVNPTKPNKDQTTPLMQAATEGDVRLITLLLNAEKNNQTSTLNNLDIIGETALYCAVANGHEEAAELLLERKACPNIAEFNYGYTSLHKAIERLDSELVILLLKHKANPNLLTKESGHPLYLVLLLSNSETRNAHFAEMFPNNPPLLMKSSVKELTAF